MRPVLVSEENLGDATDEQSKLRPNCLRCPEITSSGLLPGVAKASLLHTEVVGLAVDAPG